MDLDREHQFAVGQVQVPQAARIRGGLLRVGSELFALCALPDSVTVRELAVYEWGSCHRSTRCVGVSVGA
jgi:hypothetical protein